MADKVVVRKHRGAHAEMMACCFLLENGYEVFRNVSGVGIIDIVAVKDDQVLKIDVKQATPQLDNGGNARASGGSLSEAQIMAGVVLLFVTEEGFCHFDLRAIGDFYAELERRHHEAIYGPGTVTPRAPRTALGHFAAGPRRHGG